MNYKKMKNFITAVLTILLFVSFALFPAFAQGVNPTTTVNAPIAAQAIQAEPVSEVSSKIINKKIQTPTIKTPETPGVPELFNDDQAVGGAVVTEYDVYIKEKSTPEVQSAISNLEVKSTKIFSPVFSKIENLIVNPTLVDSKVIYSLEAEDTSQPIFKASEVIQPIFDLRVNEPVEFKLIDNKIIVNNEQIIDYKKIVRENEVMPPIELKIQSAITDGKIYDLKVIPGPNSGIFTFIHSEKKVQMPVYSDFKVEDKKLYLLENDKPYDLRINPPEIYSAVYDLTIKEPKIVIKKLSLEIENEKAVYDLQVKQPAKLLWIIPWTVESKYVIDPTDGSAQLINSPWYITSEKIGEKGDDIIFLYPE